jgi:hypothetical protein
MTDREGGEYPLARAFQYRQLGAVRMASTIADIVSSRNVVNGTWVDHHRQPDTP